jgi:hypothetical protein
MRSRRPFALALACLTCLACPAAVAGASVFLPAWGWVEDLDPVVAPNGEFLVSPEQRVDQTAARLQVIDLDAATGACLGAVEAIAVVGFERGVDPLIVPELGFGLGATVLAPVESPGGGSAGLLVLSVQANGLVSYSEFINLDDLGFVPDVDGTWNVYAGPAVAYFPLQSSTGAVRGVLAVDADPRANFGAPGVGACTLLSTDGRLLGDLNVQVDWLPGLVPGVDPESFEDLFSSRLVLPVAGAGGADLLLLDFDPSVPSPPVFLTHTSVKALNAASLRPTPFPGFEQGVDLRRFELGCGVGGQHTLLVPVEGPGDEADLYLLDKDGHSLWVLSLDGQAGGLDPFGFTPGVDMLPICGGGGAHPFRLLLPLQTADGADADLWFVDLVTGSRYASAEQLNGGLVIEGYEIGIEPLPWIDARVLVPVESPAGDARLLVFDDAGLLVDSEPLGNDWGFTRSVDPVVAAYGANRALAVPVSSLADPEQTDVLRYLNGGFAGGQSLEALNAGVGLTFGAFVPDLDPAILENWLPGRGWAILPEADPNGQNARLRCEFVPQTALNPVLLVATAATGAVPATLQMIGSVTGAWIAGFDDVHGLVPGLDLAAGRGALAPDIQPGAAIAAGADADGDPVSVEILTTHVGATQGVPAGGPRLAEFHHANPLRAPLNLRLTLHRSATLAVDILDLSGRRLRSLHEGRRPAGELLLSWDGRDDRGRPVSSGVYFAVARAGGDRVASKFVYLR